MRLDLNEGGERWELSQLMFAGLERQWSETSIPTPTLTTTA